ncbi:MAG: ATP-binding protein, partial [Candidatus Enterosoma sp.]|nr:ATP-binding protein [Candidatus Enterosoma sp.]
MDFMRFVETDKVELKEKNCDSLPKEIESFLNTEGGVLYIGINDDGDVVGVENIDSILRLISDILSDQIEPNAIDCVRPEVEFVGS